jgi:RNA polymerase sigma-70 factor (ECF subfamily)
MHGESDDVLMQRVAAGDDDAFSEIVDRYKDSLVNYLTHLVRSRERAEEVAQDAFVRLYRNAFRYQQQERLGPYLFRIATNVVVTEARREKRWSLLLPRLHASTRQSVPAPDAELFTSEIQRQVWTALDRLPINYRAPLVLFEIEGWSYDEIAKALEIACGTVKSRISRARELLRKQLAPWWTGEEHERHTNRRLDAQPAARERVAGLHS